MKQKRKLRNTLIVLLLFTVLTAALSVEVVSIEYGDSAARAWMEIDELHNLGYTGDGVTIAVIDSGCVDHDYFVNVLDTDLVKYCQVNSPTSIERADDWSDDLLDDTYNHGTKVTGVALQFAPDASFVFYEVWAPTLSVRAEKICAALKDLVDKTSEYGVDILSLSWTLMPFQRDAIASNESCSYVIGDIEQALDDLVDAGVTCFISSGNYNENFVYWPAELAGTTEGILSLGAVYDASAAATHAGKHAGERWEANEEEGSNYNANLSLTAVGVDVRTTENDGSSWNPICTGTSFAAPMAAGIAACLIEQYESVPNGQGPQDITPEFIDGRLCEKAEKRYIDDDDVEHGSGTIRPVESMINWYDYVDTKTVTYGTVSSFSNLQTGGGNAVFDETAYDEYKTWTEGFSSVPPAGWTKTGGWKKANTGGQSGSYAKCEVQEVPPLGSGYLQSKDYDTSDADRVYLEFYHMNGFYGGTLRVYVRDQWWYWDLIGTYNYDYWWTKETWSSTSFQYQHDNFAVKYDVEVSQSQWVGVDTHQVKMRYEDDTYRFSHEFQFTSISYDGYDDATLQFNIASHTGSEYLILEYYDSGWHTLNSTLGTGTHSFDVGEHISSSAFRIRIRSATDSRDTSQDSWTISALRILVLDSSVDFYT